LQHITSVTTGTLDVNDTIICTVFHNSVPRR